MTQYDDSVDELSVDDFLHEDFKSGGGGWFLDDWTEKEKDTHVDVWLNPKTPVLKFYRYEFPYVGKGKDDAPVIRYMKFNSMEPPAKMRGQYARREDGTRENPATVCPFGRFIDWLCEEMSYEDSKIKEYDTIFEVGVGKRNDDKTLRQFFAGGVLGEFDGDRLSKEKIAEIYDRTGVRNKDAFRQKLFAQQKYLFQVVPNDEPGKTLFAIQSMSLTKKFQGCVASLKEKYGDKGDPTVVPRCFRWKHLPSKPNNNDKYDCIDLPSAELTDDIKASFEVTGDAKKVVGQSNVAQLKKAMMDAWCHKRDDKRLTGDQTVTPPWDDIFAPAYEKLAGTEFVQLPEEFDFGANKGGDEPAKGRPDSVETSGGTTRRTRGAKPEPVKEEPKSEPKTEGRPKATADQFGCDVCDHVIGETELVCPTCGAEFEDKGGGLGIGLKHPKEAGTHHLVDGKYVPKQPAAGAPEATRARRRTPPQ